jgi:hypothetical protein
MSVLPYFNLRAYQRIGNDHATGYQGQELQTQALHLHDKQIDE